MIFAVKYDHVNRWAPYSLLNDVPCNFTSSRVETKKGTEMTVVSNDGQLMYLASFQKQLRSVNIKCA